MAKAYLFLAVFFLYACGDQQEEKTQKQEVPAASKHSTAFNASIQAALQSYYNLTEAFVKWDSAAVPAAATDLETKLDSIRLDELTGDRSQATNFLSAAKADLQKIESSNDLAAKRESFNVFTNQLYQFLNVVQYDREKIYLQQCPMAFNDTGAGVWLSAVDSIRNPYLGLHHPRYGKGMLECGENKEVVNFTGLK